MPSLRASLLARHAAHDAELTRRRRRVLADLAPAAPPRLSFATLWRELFVAARPAWIALACTWLLLLALNTVNRPSAAEAASTASSLTDTRPPLLVWREREMAFAALLSPPPRPAPALPSGTPTSFCPPGRRSRKATLVLVS